MKYLSDIHPLTGDIIWKIETLDLSEITNLIKKFIEENLHENYSLSIYDTITSKTIEIECSVDEMPTIVEFIVHLEKGFPIEFIGVNKLSDSYVIGMPLCRGRIDFGSYKAQDGHIVALTKE